MMIRIGNKLIFGLKRQRNHVTLSLSRVASSGSNRGTFFPSRADTASLITRNKSSSISSNVSKDQQEKTTLAPFNKIAFLGAGNMGQAILNPVIRSGLQPAPQIAVFDLNPDTLQRVVNDHPDIQVAQNIPELVEDADLVVCAIKPNNITPHLLEEIQKADRPTNATFLSVIAGIPLNTYEPTGFNKIVRSMPNTPAMIGRGMTVWCSTNSLTTSERDRIDSVLSCLGETMYVDDEQQVDMSTAISGSGPAYIFNLMEDMIDAGVHMGFPRDKATKLVYHTLLGSTLYAMETGEHPAILRNNVTSPNGTTASAIYELENGGFNIAVKDAMWACYRRSLEMGGKDANVGPGRPSQTVSEQQILGHLLDPTSDETHYQLTIERKDHNGDEHWIKDLKDIAEDKWIA